MTTQVQSNGSQLPTFVPFAMRWAEAYPEAKDKPVQQMFSSNVDGMTTELVEPDKLTTGPDGTIGADCSFTFSDQDA